MIDSTFGTPINQRPAEFGIDLVMHSGTKYLSGHADLTCGVVCGRRQVMEEIDESRKTLGNCMDPHAAWLLIRGLKTLAVRVARQNENALRVAEFLDQHAKSAAGALSLPEEPSGLRDCARANERRQRHGHL